MTVRKRSKLLMLIGLFALIFTFAGVTTGRAESPNNWWDNEWPYRISITAENDGVAAVNINFSNLFAELGLEGALLDIRSIRVVPYRDGIAGDPIPYEETYSRLVIDGDALNEDPASGQPFWLAEDMFTLTLDESRFTQGTGAIHAHFEFIPDISFLAGIHYYLEGSELDDWSAYETLIYDVWPEVNEKALDQTTDLYFFKLDGLQSCPSGKINGPSLSMDSWNHVSVSLTPFGNCVNPDTSSLESLYFYLELASYLNEYTGYDEGDVLDLWLDNFRLVDQDGDGVLRWQVDPDVDRYYIYFDTLNHEGHPLPEMITVGEGTHNPDSGLVEVGGYFHLISNAETGELLVWKSPPVEKILKTNKAPITAEPLMIYATRGEFESMQLVVRSPVTQALNVSVSDLKNGSEVIPASQVVLFRVDYIEITQLSDSFGRLGLWPDPLYPVTLGEEILFTAEENQPLWFRIEVPSTAQSGTYMGTIGIGSSKIPFSLIVWNFDLPSDPALPSKVGFDWETVLETYGGTNNGVPQECHDQLVVSIFESFEDYHLTPATVEEPGEPEEVLLYSLTDYEVATAHDQQLKFGKQVWWEFTSFDTLPFANPAVIDRTGLDARILPWLAWLDDVDGLYYFQSTDWSPNPWLASFSNHLSNGDGFLFYPPKDDTLGYDPCEPESNRLVPSIRLELLREGMEDYAYLKLLNGQTQGIALEKASDDLTALFIDSRTSFSRIPSRIDSVRIEIAGLLVHEDDEDDDEEKIIHCFFPIIIR